MSKSVDAFRTIGEVAEELDVPKHVLRFWEGKFPHIRPMKRGGGRRYYRPEDMELLRGIRHLLHAEGYTIKGVQKILREQGIDQVKAAAAAAGAAKAAAEKRSTKARAQAQKPASTAPASKSMTPSAQSTKSASPSASAGEAHGAPRADTSTGKGQDKSAKDVISGVIRELEACRQLLTASVGTAPARATPPLRAARS
jgi:DNA-binding transcriptional MerR regulator